MEVKILVVGFGSIGRRHATNAAAHADTAVYDADPQRGRECASAGIRCFETFEDALAWAPHAVIVATPHQQHLPVAAQAIEAGADVLIEKPISDSLEGLNDFLDRADALGRRVWVVCNMRFHPAVAALRTNLGRIGKALFATAHFGNYLPAMRPQADYRDLYAARRSTGGGVILDAIHEIDYLMWLFGGVRSVLCRADTVSDLDIDVEDYALISLEHESKTYSTIQLDYVRRFKSRGCEIVGTEGTLLWQSDGKQPEKCSVKLFEQRSGQWSTLVDLSAVDDPEIYRTLIEQFVTELNIPGTSNLLTGRAAAAELRVALDALAYSSQPKA